MQRTIVWYGAGVFVLLALLFGLGFTSFAQSNGVIKGKVTGDGNLPLANVPVKAYYQENVTGFITWYYAGQATTDSTGAYTISNLAEGIYHISFNEYPPLAGYFSEFYNNVGTQESGTDITLAAGATVNNINAKLSSGAHIKGKVTDLQGKPLSGVRVMALDTNNSSNTFFDTGADGLYDIGNLQAGNYRIAFDDTREPLIYRKAYYNNAKELELASVVTVATDQTVNNINTQLNRLGFITGKVTNEQNNSLSNIQLTAQRRTVGPEGEFWQDMGFAGTNGNGNYVLGGLYEGVYRVRFRDTNDLKYSTEYYNNVYDPTAATVLTVTLNNTITNINAQLALRGGISGAVTNSSGNPLFNIEVIAEQYVEIAPGVGNWVRVHSIKTDASGLYRLCCLDAIAHRILFRDPSPLYLPEYYDNVYYDYHSLLDNVTMVQVTTNMTITGVNAELSTFSKLVINATDQQGQPVSDIRVTLYRNDPAHNDEWYNTYIQAEKVNNSYQISTMPGRYRLYVEDGRNPTRYIGEFYNNAVDLSAATDITLTEESTVTIGVILDESEAFKRRIEGRVTDPAGNPAPDITVSAYQSPTFPNTSWDVVMQATTDQNGEYTLSGLIPNTYRIGFFDIYSPQEFVKEYYNDAVTLETATDIIVTDGVAVHKIDAPLGRLNRINGLVTNESGSPLSDIQVTFYRYSDLGNHQFDWQSVTAAQTDANGIYNSSGLERGLYRIGFQDYNNNYHTEFYNNVGYVENAMTFTLTTNLVITDINAQLPTNPFTWSPLAQKDQITVTEGGIASSGNNGLLSVLFNDRADSGNPLQANLVTQPTHGALTFNQDGTFIYTHNGDEATSDFFTYSASDGTQQSNVAKVTIIIQPVNDPPIANNDSATVARGQHVATLDSGAKSLLANDSDPDSHILTATLTTAPAHGAVTINANGTFTYTHDGSTSETDSFVYQAADALSSTAVATVTVAINPFTFSKTLGIAGFQPFCTPVNELHTPIGTTIVYCYTIHNLGAAPLTTHSLVDSHLGTLLTNQTHTVAPGAVFSVTFTQTLTVSTTNVATWTSTSDGIQALSAAVTPNIAKTAATVIIAGPTDDTDQDTIPDNLEKADDTDGDNLPNFLDTDADGDGKLDKDEVGSNPAQPADSDQDGIPDYLDAQTGAVQQQLFLPVIKR